MSVSETHIPLKSISADQLVQLVNFLEGKQEAVQQVEKLSDGAIDWKELRKNFFNECTTETPREETGKKVVLAPHDLFEWFKREISEYVPPTDGKPPVVGSASYRQSFGLDNPPKGEVLKLKYAEGVRYYLLWIKCPDNENIVEGWFPTKTSALKYAKDNGWEVVS